MPAASQQPARVVDGRSAVHDELAEPAPVGNAFRFQDVFDNHHPLYAGDVGIGINPKLAERVRQSDLILAIGTRLGDVASLGYTFPECPAPKQTLVHVYPDGKPIGHVFRTDLGLIADPVAVLAGLAQSPRVVSAGREAWISSLNGVVRDLQVYKPVDAPDGMDFGVVVDSLSRLAPKDAIVVEEGEADHAGGAGAVLGDEDLRRAPVRRVRVVVLVPVQEHHDVRILLQRSGLAEVGEHGEKR